jgi:hypothetical protein
MVTLLKFGKWKKKFFLGWKNVIEEKMAIIGKASARISHLVCRNLHLIYNIQPDT